MKGVKGDAITSGDRDKENKTTTFYIIEFGDKTDAKCMYQAFMGMRDIDEVIIPPKRNARRNTYGFIRFFNMKNNRLLATKLDNIFLDGRKIFANIPRFQRKEINLKQKVLKHKVEFGMDRQV